MVSNPKFLPGLERLTGVLSQFDIPPRLKPAFSHAPKAGELVLGSPFDPQLATLYSCTDGGRVGDLRLFCFGKDSHAEIIDFNEWWRDNDLEILAFRKEVLYFGGEVGASCYFAVVPSLADAEGVQPVLYIDEYEETFIYPFASSVDKAFNLWAHYCEKRLVKYGLLEMWKVEEYDFSIKKEIRIIIEDHELIRMMKAGSFDRFVNQSRVSRMWVDSVIRAAAG